MPTLYTTLMAGHGEHRKARLIAALSEAVVGAIDAPLEAVTVILDEVPRAHYGIAGRAATPATPARALLQAFLIAGRSDAQKVRLVAALTAAVAGTLDAAPGDVRVFIQDVPNTDFGLGGQTAAALGRGIGRAALVQIN